MAPTDSVASKIPRELYAGMGSVGACPDPTSGNKNNSTNSKTNVL